jgi:hypothetical protein
MTSISAFKHLLLSLLLLGSLSTQAQKKHVFYLHGRIIEVQGPNAVETANGYGPYRYQAILDTFVARGCIVHSEVRPATTTISDYAQHIATEIQQLLKSGVMPADITVIGASKGAAIAMTCSSLLKNKELRYVWLAGCCDATALPYSGKILSVFEASDACGSCNAAVSDRTWVTEFKEVRLQTGLKHGFFYTPRAEWLGPTFEWIFGK